MSDEFEVVSDKVHIQIALDHLNYLYLKMRSEVNNPSPAPMRQMLSHLNYLREIRDRLHEAMPDYKLYDDDIPF